MSVARPEWSERRILAAIIFLDALGRRVRVPVAASAPGVAIRQKEPGMLIVADAPGLADHVTSFAAPPAVPAVGSVELSLDLIPADPTLAPRAAVVPLPRDPDPAAAANANSLFRPQEIVLWPSPLAGPTGLAAALRVTLRRAGDGRRIEGAVVRVQPEGRPPALALTDAAGEALLLVPGVPLATPGDGAVVLPDIGATVMARVDPAMARFHAEAELAAARAAAARRRTGLPDPDTLLTRAGLTATAERAVRLAAGRTRHLDLDWTPP
jgi:hypothetical protein